MDYITYGVLFNGVSILKITEVTLHATYEE